MSNSIPAPREGETLTWTKTAEPDLGEGQCEPVVWTAAYAYYSAFSSVDRAARLATRYCAALERDVAASLTTPATDGARAGVPDAVRAQIARKVDKLIGGNPTCESPEDHVTWLTGGLEEIRTLIADPRPQAGGAPIIKFAKAILHGDDEHRAWLLEAADAFVAGRPMPEPRGKGTGSPQAGGAPGGTDREHAGGIYIASKTAHAARWRQLRADGVPIISTWIDEAGVGETACFTDLWRRCVDEVKTASAVVLYREPGEVLKGAFVEAGAALAVGVPVFAVGCEEFSVSHHAGLTCCATLDEALSLAASTRPAADPGAQAGARKAVGLPAEPGRDGDAAWFLRNLVHYRNDCSFEDDDCAKVQRLIDAALSATPAPAATGVAGADRDLLSISRERLEGDLDQLLQIEAAAKNPMRDRIIAGALAQATPPAPSADPVPAGQGDGANKIHLVVRVTGEYSDRSEDSLFYTRSHDEAKNWATETQRVCQALAVETNQKTIEAIEAGDYDKEAEIRKAAKDRCPDPTFEPYGGYAEDVQYHVMTIPLAPPAPSNAGGA